MILPVHRSTEGGDGPGPHDHELRGRPGLSALARVLVVWLTTALALMLMSALLAGFDVLDLGVALVTAALIGLLNALAWPVVIGAALPLTVLTLGLGPLLLNGAIVYAVAAIEPGVTVSGVGEGVVVTLGLTLVTAGVTSILAIDDDDFWHRNVVRRHARRVRATGDLTVPGVYFLEVDGLAHEVLRRAIRDGNTPNLAAWLRGGTHRLICWETDWSSQTGACQAGLLHGDNHDMPAFRWWEKDRGRPIVTNHPRDAAELERRHSNGRGLLHDDGASRANIVSGDAPHTLLTMSTVLDRDRPGRIGQDYFAYFAYPYNVARTLVRVVGDMAQERRYAAEQRRQSVRPRIARSRRYALVRAWGTVVQTDLQVQAVIADLYAGRPVGYSTFLAYDEVAHHSGVERADALAVLRRVDRELGRIVAAARFAPRPYRFVVLSDHGQSQGETFLDRYEMSLEDLVRRACEADEAHTEPTSTSEALGYLSASLTEASAADSAPSRAVGAATRRQRVDGVVHLGATGERPGSEGELPELSVMASGCLGLVTFPRENGRVTLEQMRERWPRLLPALSAHPGIGFTLVRSERRGATVIGPAGVNYLDEQRVVGADPLAPFGANAERHVKRTDRFPHCPDLMINSTYWPDTDEVAAFEELVGSHGGLGGGQSFPFALVPAEWRVPKEPVVGAEAMHAHFRTWLADLGHVAYSAPEAIGGRGGR